MSVLAPNINEPSPLTYRDASKPITFDWDFQHSNLAESQSEWALRRKEEGGSHEWWDADTETWSGTEVYNVGSETEYTFSNGEWLNGKTYLWALSTKDQDGESSDYTSDFPLDTAHRPVAAIIEPQEGDTVVSDTDNVVVAWDYTNDSGHPQQSYCVKVFLETTTQEPEFDVESSIPLWDSGEVTTRVMQSTFIQEYLPSAAHLVVYVCVTSRVGLRSDWDNKNFTVLQGLLVSGPNVEATPDPQAGVVNIAVSNTSTFIGLGTGKMFIERSKDGQYWQIVPGTSEQEISGDSVIITDHVPFISNKVYYRARMVLDV